MFITFEGIDGSGKSLQIKRCAKGLEANGREIVVTREPGGTEGAEELRGLVLNGATDRWSAMSELLIFTAARRDHCERVIWPALERGAVVLCDRFVDSTRLYQGLAGDGMMDAVNNIHAAAIGLEADLTLVFDLEPARAFERMSERDDTDMRFEGHGLAFQEKRRAGFHKLADEHPDRIVMINADQSIANVTRDMMQVVGSRLNA